MSECRVEDVLHKARQQPWERRVLARERAEELQQHRHDGDGGSDYELGWGDGVEDQQRQGELPQVFAPETMKGIVTDAVQLAIADGPGPPACTSWYWSWSC